MLSRLLKFFSIDTTPITVYELPQAKTVATVTAMFTQVLVDLKEVQDNAISNIAEATESIKALQDDIVENSKESEKAKVIMDKIQGLLQ